MLETSIDAEPRGDAVAFAVRVTNHGSEGVTLSFSDTQRVRVTLSEVGDDEPRWRSDDGHMFGQMLGSETVAAGEEAVFREEWEDPEPGEYRAVGEVVCENEELRAETTVSI